MQYKHHNLIIGEWSVLHVYLAVDHIGKLILASATYHL